MAQQCRHERRLGVGRRLLLVLPVVRRSSLAAEEPEHRSDHEERGECCERKHDEPGAERIVLELVDSLLILRILLGVRLLLGDDLPEPSTVLDAHARGRRESATRVDGAKLDELLGRHVERTQQRAWPSERDVSADPHRVAPGAHDVSRPRGCRREAAECLLPLVTPDLEVDVDDVVIADGEPGEAVADRECARLSRRLESPDDANSTSEIADSERPGRAARLELGRCARSERASVLEHRDIRDALAAPVGDLAKAVREVEVAPEGDRDPLFDGDAPVGLDPCLDVGLDELVRLGEGRRCDCERDKSRNCSR